MQTSDTISKEATATGTLYTGKGWLKHAYVRAAVTAGTAVFKDGGAGGTVILTIDTPAAIGGVNVPCPGNGIAFVTSLHVTLTTADATTVMIEPDRSL